MRHRAREQQRRISAQPVAFGRVEAYIRREDQREVLELIAHLLEINRDHLRSPRHAEGVHVKVAERARHRERLRLHVPVCRILVRGEQDGREVSARILRRDPVDLRQSAGAGVQPAQHIIGHGGG